MRTGVSNAAQRAIGVPQRDGPEGGFWEPEDEIQPARQVSGVAEREALAPPQSSGPLESLAQLAGEGAAVGYGVTPGELGRLPPLAVRGGNVADDQGVGEVQTVRDDRLQSLWRVEIHNDYDWVSFGILAHGHDLEARLGGHTRNTSDDHVVRGVQLQQRHLINQLSEWVYACWERVWAGWVGQCDKRLPLIR